MHLRVVRLKGANSFVLGHGGDEISARALVGIRAEITLGISSAAARSAILGIPVTHRCASR